MKNGFDCVHGIKTQIRFPKKMQTALEFDNLLDRFDKQVIKGYAIEIVNDEIWITVKVNNLICKKNKIKEQEKIWHF